MRTWNLLVNGFARLALLCCALGLAPAHAASLGDLVVKSKLYEPFHAQIMLRGVAEDDLESLRVSLADKAVFERAGLPRPYNLSHLKFEVVTRGARSAYVKISTEERVREPSLSFVIEATFAGSTSVLRRRYDVLLDLR